MKKYISLIIIASIFGFSYAQEQKVYTISNLKMNTNKGHFSPTFYKDNMIVFSSESKKIKTKKGGQVLYKLQIGSIDESHEIVDIQDFTIFKTIPHNLTNAIFSSDFNKIYVTTNYIGVKKVYKQKYKRSNLRIMVGEYIKGEGYTNFKTLSFCNPDYSYGHPALSPDGNTLYFVSNIVSARGATDMFKVKILGDNKFSKPENLGLKINSVRKELFPFVSKDNVLYFSSDRTRGVGGLDIYYSKIEGDSSYSKPKLLSKPINSRLDDFGFVLNQDGKTGYFSSRRPKGKGGDDIYFFTINDD
jgi:hypothetical protein